MSDICSSINNKLTQISNEKERIMYHRIWWSALLIVLKTLYFLTKLCIIKERALSDEEVNVHDRCAKKGLSISRG